MSGSSEDNGEKNKHPKVRIQVIEDHTTEMTVKLPPPDFTLEFIEGNQHFDAEIKFDISVDDGDTKTKQTDRHGTIKIYKPEKKLKLTLASEKESPPPKKEQRRATNDEDVLTPVRFQ